jgi:pyruvate dehydrogenase E2 component (dihydrolipoyllysine-residue acetyltransferase)
MKGITLDRRKNGDIRARFTGPDGKRISWNTHARDKAEAMRRAGEELARRKGPSAAAPPPAAPSAPSGPLPAVASPRRPLGAAFARVLQLPAPPGLASTAAPAAAVELVAKPDEITPPAAPAPAADEGAELAKVRRVHQVVGKSATNLIEGILARTCRFAGREPEEMDEDERALIAEGCSEIAAEYLGKKKLTPAGKVIAGSVCAGVGMYMGGKPIPKKPAPVLQLVPPAAQPAPAPAVDRPPPAPPPPPPAPAAAAEPPSPDGGARV